MPLQPHTAPSSTLQTPTYVPETAAPNTTRATSTGPLPSKQKNLLRDIAGLALSYSTPVSPGQVTRQQDQVLSAWEQNAASDYSQFMFNQGLSAVASNPSTLFNSERAATQSQWSMEDAQSALSFLNLSAKDWDEYQKMQAQEHQRHLGLIGGVVEMAAGIALSFTGVGAAVGVPLAVQGAGQAMGNS